MHVAYTMQPPIPLAYVDDNALSYAKQIVKTNMGFTSTVIGRIRDVWNRRPPERIRNLLIYGFAIDCLRRWIDRAGLVLDSGDIIKGMATATTTWKNGDIIEWMVTNFVIMGVAGYLIWPATKGLLVAIHKWATER